MSGRERCDGTSMTTEPGGSVDDAVMPELLIANLVRDWAGRMLPGEPGVAERAAAQAVRCYAGGASVSEACREARRFVECWSHHPSHQPLRHTNPLRLAS